MLSLFGAPIGQVYCGRIRRAVLFWVVGMLIVPAIALSLVTFPLGRTGILILIAIGLAFPIVQAVDAALIARTTIQPKKLVVQRWWVYLLLIVIAYFLNYGIAIFVKTYIAEVFMVPTRGMAPTIQPGDRIIVDKLWTDPGRLRRNDVVVFQSPDMPSVLFVMRLVGLAGDHLSIIDGRKFHINDREIEFSELHLNGELLRGNSVPAVADRTVAADSFFVVGDNLNLSRDSRTFGDVPNRNLFGTARAILWSQPRIFPNPNDRERFTLGPISWDRIGMPFRSD
jgi:signal peptidase I